MPGTDDDILNKRGALISKAIRTIGLRIIPGDLCDEAEDIIKHIRLDEAAKDPDAERRKIVDAFAAIGVTATDLTGYLGHDLGKCSPTQIVTLRGIYGAIKDGEATWQSVMQNKADQTPGAPTSKDPVPCTPEIFEKKKAGWKAIIEGGKKTVNDLIATIQTKEILSNDQKVEIASWLPSEGK